MKRTSKLALLSLTTLLAGCSGAKSINFSSAKKIAESIVKAQENFKLDQLTMTCSVIYYEKEGKNQEGEEIEYSLEVDFSKAFYHLHQTTTCMFFSEYSEDSHAEKNDLFVYYLEDNGIVLYANDSDFTPDFGVLYTDEEINEYKASKGYQTFDESRNELTYSAFSEITNFGNDDFFGTEILDFLIDYETEDDVLSYLFDEEKDTASIVYGKTKSGGLIFKAENEITYEPNEVDEGDTVFESKYNGVRAEYENNILKTYSKVRLTKGFYKENDKKIEIEDGEATNLEISLSSECVYPEID